MTSPNLNELSDDDLVKRALDVLWRHVKDKYRPQISRWCAEGEKVTAGMRYFIKNLLAPPELNDEGDLVLADLVYASWQEYCNGDVDDLPDDEFVEMLGLCKAINERL